MDPKELRDPWLVAAWPGMGVVGLGALTYLATALGAEPLGELSMQGFFAHDRLAVRAGLLLPVRRPRAVLLGWRAPPPGRDLVLLLGEAQPTSRAWDFARQTIDAIRALGVRQVVTFAAMASAIEPSEPPRVFAAASTPALLDEARRNDLTPLDDGQVAGVNGLIVAAAAEEGIPGLCLLGELPAFAGGYPNPAASCAVLRAFGRLARVEVDLGALDAEARVVQAHLVELLARARDLAGRYAGEAPRGESDDGGEDLELRATSAGEREPPGARDQVESLFAAASADRSRAVELKAELDRLGLFREYEDRFLDLFRSRR